MKRRTTENRKVIYQTIDQLGHISLIDLNEYLLKKEYEFLLPHYIAILKY